MWRHRSGLKSGDRPQNAPQHTQQSGKQKGVSDMSATPRGKSSSNPERTREDAEYSPTPTQVVRCLILWFRGFHWNREKPKATDWVTVGLTFLVAVAAFWSAWIFQGQLNEVRRSTRLSVRPWVGLDEGLDAIETTPLQVNAGGTAGLVYTIRTKNYSNTPAANVWAMAQLVVADDLNTAYEQQGYMCSDAVIGKPDIGMVLFQGRDRPFTSYPSATKISRKHENSLIGVWLAGCIGYRDQFGYLCRTKFLWSFSPDDPSQAAALQSSPVPAMTVVGHFTPTASGNAIDTCQVPKYK